MNNQKSKFGERMRDFKKSLKTRSQDNFAELLSTINSNKILMKS